MPFGRGFVTAALLILIVLSCITVARRLERERRLIAKLRARGAVDAEHAIPLVRLSDDEQDTAESLVHAGVLRSRNERCYIASEELGPFRRKRARLALSGIVAAVFLVFLVAGLILWR
ncbi:hypothetical protein [Caldimonas thermodepolymerans]|jgi:hypothetical protein|uniref:hypothetical protein n=1 Tax=Caldimonas thermodepolymerans TaxID=215580 RepID=UPI000DB469B0|nr:hypothetical protein [Caldimonas thermodepolymerans]PZN77860.1 MAG: hypothetical protein DIU56_10610 [Pseudomonadota bacterium]